MPQLNKFLGYYFSKTKLGKVTVAKINIRPPYFPKHEGDTQVISISFDTIHTNARLLYSGKETQFLSRKMFSKLPQVDIMISLGKVMPVYLGSMSRYPWSASGIIPY